MTHSFHTRRSSDLYQITPKTAVNASYSEALETSQQRAISSLGNLILDPETGELIDETTGEPFTGDDPFTFDDETTRTKTLLLGANHRSGRNTFRLTGLAGTAEGGPEGDEEFYQTRFRSEARRVGKECVSKGKYRWSTDT